MTGIVDAAWRSLLTVSLHNPVNGQAKSFDAWVDTGFNGDLVLPLAQVTSLGLPAGFSIRAVLADGSEVEVKTYSGDVNWFGVLRATEIIANDGTVPLLGTGLLRGRKLCIDYAACTLALD